MVPLMTAMTELTGNAAEEFLTEADKDETSLVEAFNDTLDISQDVELTESAASEETKNRERKDEGQQDGQPVCPPATASSSSESKWAVGAQCRAVWSEDGQVYPAAVVSLDGQRCTVRFSGYGNQDNVELSALQNPDAPQTQTCQDWRPGSRCRAVYSEDRLVYPAVVLWVKDQRCRVRFDDYNNEEEMDVNDLLHPDELHGPSRATRTKGSSWKSSVTSNLDWKRRREERQRERGGERRSGWRDEEQNFSSVPQVKEKASDQSKVEKEAEEKKRGNQESNRSEKPTNHSFCFFPPPPPPHLSGFMDPMSFIPPPLPPPPPSPPWPASVDSSSMLMLWYMCGFHTGSYMAHQGFKSSSKD